MQLGNGIYYSTVHYKLNIFREVNQRLQIQFGLLMMRGIPLETCWAFNERWNNKFCYKVASCWLFLLSPRKNSFNIITVVISRKARHSKPSIPFSFFHINSKHFHLSQCCHPCQKFIYFCHKSGTCFRDKLMWSHAHSCAHIFNVKIMPYWQSTFTQLSHFCSFERPLRVMNYA